MSDTEKDRLAALVVDQHFEFERALAGSRKGYPTREFRSFATVVEYLRSERKRVPGNILLEAERLECLLFLGYDPHFDGDEPPGL
jgi:hypothetical protein